MKALCAFFMRVVFLVAVCCVNEADAQYKWSRFFLGTLGVHTVDGTAFDGLTGFLGGSKNNSGLGIMESYETGSKTVWGYNVQLRLINVYFSVTYRLGQSMFILFQGVSTVIATAENNDRDDRSRSTTAISYVYDPNRRFVFFGQAHLQGQGLMLSAGVGS